MSPEGWIAYCDLHECADTGHSEPSSPDPANAPPPQAFPRPVATFSNSVVGRTTRQSVAHAELARKTSKNLEDAGLSEPFVSLSNNVPSEHDGTTSTFGRKVTEKLAGSTFVQGYKLTTHAGTTIVFPFSDLSVRAEGKYVLVYRCFNILGASSSPVPRQVLAICVGAPFQVYGTKVRAVLGGIDVGSVFLPGFSRFGSLNTAHQGGPVW
jgi:hypothetical protein